MTNQCCLVLMLTTTRRSNLARRRPQSENARAKLDKLQHTLPPCTHDGGLQFA